MQAVILVGGKGERLKPLTDRIPKPMVDVAGKPFLEHLVILLKKNGVKRFLFLAGYLGDIISDYFGNGNKWGVTIDYSFEDKPMGTGGALRLAMDKLDEDFLLLFGDSYLPIDYMRMASEYRSGTGKAILAVYDNAENTTVPFNIVLDKSRKEVSVYNKAKDNPLPFNYCDAGVLIVNKTAIDLISENKPMSFEEVIYPRLVAGKQLGCFISEHRFYDIGTIDRLNEFKEYISGKNSYFRDTMRQPLGGGTYKHRNELKQHI